MITIVDSGGANIASILFALERLGVHATVSVDADVIKNASYVILPGVGSADKIMQRLVSSKLDHVIRSLTQPVLGICVGMQVLFEFSEEGDVACLNIIPGKIKKLKQSAWLTVSSRVQQGIQDNEKLILPHMGWNTFDIIQNSPLLKNIPNASYVYFVHSFKAAVLPCTRASTTYGESFSAVVEHQNFFGTQFHPERSGVVGSQILKNFLEI